MAFDLPEIRNLANVLSMVAMAFVIILQSAAGFVAISEWCSGQLPPKTPKSFMLFRLAAFAMLVLAASAFIADDNWVMWVCLAGFNQLIVHLKTRQLIAMYASLSPQTPMETQT